MKKQIIIVPGIMGSRLRKNKQTIWPVLSLVRDSYDEYLKYDELTDNVVAYEEYKSIYSKITKSLKNKDVEVTAFYYDWRKNNLEHLELLKGFINPEAEEIIFVAHSMGGILVKLFMNYFNDDEITKKVKKIITMGTPWKGAPYAYKAIKYGVGIPHDKFAVVLSKFSTKILAPTFPSLYQLLPSKKYHDKCLKDNKTSFFFINEEKQDDFDTILDEHYWPLIKENFKKDNAYTDILLNYYDYLEDDFEVEHYEIIGYGLQTICTIKENILKEPEGLYDNGDGTVPVLSAFSESSKKFYIQEKHQKLPKNESVIELVNQIINNVSVTNILGVSTDYDKIKNVSFNGKVIKIACPVVVSLKDQEGKFIFGNIELLDEESINVVQNENFDVDTVGNTVYIFLPDEIPPNNYSKSNIPEKISIEAYDSGPTTISLENYNNGEIEKVSSFKTFNINTSIEVELLIPNKIEESKLVIKEMGKDDVTRESQTLEIEDKDIISPSTKLRIESTNQHTLKDESSVVVSGETIISIEKLTQGTYPISGTYYSINNSEYQLISESDLLVLNLDRGINELLYFSKDMSNHSEKLQKTLIYNIENVLPEVNFDFFPHQYVVQVVNPNQEINNNIGYETTPTKIEFKNDDGVIGENVFYKNIERELEIGSESIFGKDKMYFNIDEHILNAIFDGTFDERALFDFLEKINVLEPYDYVKLQKFEKGYYKKITKENVKNSKHISIRKNNITVNIYKDIDVLVSFQYFTQDIKLSEQESYPFAFKVIHLETNKEIRSMKFVAVVTTMINNEEFISNDVEIEFNEESDSYEGNFNLKELKDFLEQFWDSNSLYTINLVIQQDGSVKKVLETESITIR